jgi:putative ubiquitin-RnfH superfamily antitoxin RatB of RatAB toxin-antitoxin module
VKVEVVLALPDRAEVVAVTLAPGATVADAVALSGLKGESFGVFGKRVPPHHPLSDGDRVEIYRPLRMDAKEARRQRARKRPNKPA